MTTLFCAEPLRPMACCVLDSLTARGWHATLETGDAARNALRRFRDPSVGLRVLCVPDPMPADTAQALLRALDPYNRGDLLVIHFKTPRDVIAAIERFVGIKQRRVRRAAPLGRSTRSYLSHQTLVEQQLQLGRWSGYGLATVAGMSILAAAFQFGADVGKAHPEPAPLASRVMVVETAAVVTSPLVDRQVLSAAAATPLDAEDRPPNRPNHVRGAALAKQPNPKQDAMKHVAAASVAPADLEPALEIPDDVEDLGEVPLEEIGLVLPSDMEEIFGGPMATPDVELGVPGISSAGEGAPSRRRAPILQTIDPFATAPSAEL